MIFDSKETEKYFYDRCKSIGYKLNVSDEFIVDYEYAENYLNMIEDGLKSGRFNHLSK